MAISSSHIFLKLRLLFRFCKIDFWVSGRDKLDSTQFVWDFTETEIPTNIPYDRHIYDFPYQTCLRYASNPDNKSHLYPRQCNQQANRLICETS